MTEEDVIDRIDVGSKRDTESSLRFSGFQPEIIRDIAGVLDEDEFLKTEKVTDRVDYSHSTVLRYLKKLRWEGVVVKRLDYGYLWKLSEEE